MNIQTVEGVSAATQNLVVSQALTSHTSPSLATRTPKPAIESGAIARPSSSKNLPQSPCCNCSSLSASFAVLPPV